MIRSRTLVRRGSVTIESYVDGDGPAIVILPSYGRAGGEDFDPLTSSLVAAGYRVLRPQPRGIAGSVGPMDGVTIDDLASDVAAVVAELADTPVVVLGHAFGNFVARAIATNHPSVASAVVLAAASGPTVDPRVNAAPLRAGDLTLPESERLDALRLAFFAPGHDPSIWLPGWYPETLRMQHAAVSGIDLSRYWGAGTAPILEVIAELDPFHQPQEWGELRSRYGQRVTSTVIERASHALFPEQPEAVADAILSYLWEMAR
jgi:pimeloyl-ACP methyl ester carboxylesterase